MHREKEEGVSVNCGFLGLGRKTICKLTRTQVMSLRLVLVGVRTWEPRYSVLTHKHTHHRETEKHVNHGPFSHLYNNKFQEQ